MNPPSLYPGPESNRHPITGPHFECGAATITPPGFSLLRRPDSNGEYKCQKLVCCRYTTAQFRILYPNGNVGSKFNDKAEFVTGFAHSVCGRANKCINVGFNLKFHSEIQQVKRHFRFHYHSIYCFREPARAVG